MYEKQLYPFVTNACFCKRFCVRTSCPRALYSHSCFILQLILRIIMAWCGVAWHGIVWHGIVWHGMTWYGVAWNGMVWHGMVWCGIAWHGVVWHCVVLHGVVWLLKLCVCFREKGILNLDIDLGCSQETIDLTFFERAEM
jgi:hypothetical protein